MDAFEKLYNQSLRFLSFRPRSAKEIIDFLTKPRGKKKEKPEDAVVQKIITKLKQLNFVNDEEFARWWVEQRTGSRPKGLRLIKIELQQKGVDKDTIEKILSDEDIKILSDGSLERLIAKQYLKYSKLPKQEAYQKLSQFLLRRGFDWEAAKEAIDEIRKKEYNKPVNSY